MRSLVLGPVGTPYRCPAFAGVTDATIECSHTALNRNLWRLLPSLRRLELVDMDWNSGMLAVHDGRLLSEVCVRGIIPRPDTLHRLGYMLIHKLSLYGRSSIWQVATWPDHAPRTEAALSVRSSGQMELVLRMADGKEIHCAETAVSFDEIRELLMDEYFSRILTHFVLPLRLPRARNSLEIDERGGTDCLILRDHLDLPALRTLVLRYEDATPDTDALICPTNRRGVAYAPRLSRIVVDVHHETYDRVHELRASHLAAFITNAIEVNDVSNLELFIDTASGLRLHPGDGDCDDEIEQLRTCVGNLLL